MKNSQNGFGFIHIVAAVILVVLLAAGIKYQHKRVTEEQRVAAIQAAERDRIEQERQKKISEEKAAFDKQLEDERNKSNYEKSIADLKSIKSRWDDAIRLADSTARIALSQPVAKLQDIKREASALIVPACLSSAKSHLISGMSSAIDGFIGFMTEKNSIGFYKVYFITYSDEIDQYEKAKSNCGF